MSVFVIFGGLTLVWLIIGFIRMLSKDDPGTERALIIVLLFLVILFVYGG